MMQLDDEEEYALTFVAASYGTWGGEGWKKIPLIPFP